MNRKDTKKIIVDKINLIRSHIKDACLRTTCIVGFPSETKEEFEELLEFIKEVKFNKLGAFAYSKEEHTASYDFKNQLTSKVKNSRLKEILKVQDEISKEVSYSLLNKELEVLVYDITEDNKYFVCLSDYNAPDVDGEVYIKVTKENINKIIIGEYVKVKVINTKTHDLYCKEEL